MLGPAHDLHWVRSFSFPESTPVCGRFVFSRTNGVIICTRSSLKKKTLSVVNLGQVCLLSAQQMAGIKLHILFYADDVSMLKYA